MKTATKQAKETAVIAPVQEQPAIRTVAEVQADIQQVESDRASLETVINGLEAQIDRLYGKDATTLESETALTRERVRSATRKLGRLADELKAAQRNEVIEQYKTQVITRAELTDQATAARAIRDQKKAEFEAADKAFNAADQRVRLQSAGILAFEQYNLERLFRVSRAEYNQIESATIAKWREGKATS